RSPTHKKDTAESSAPKRSTVIHFRLPERRSTRLTPPVPVLTVEKANKMILQDTLQVSLAEHKSREEQKARENVELVKKLVEGSENVIDDSSPPRNDEPQIPGTRLEPRSDKESPEVERTNDEEVEVTNVVIPVNVNEEEDEITDEVYELKRREKGKIVEESRSTPLPTPIRSPRTHTNLVSSDTEKLQELTETHTQTTSSSRSQHTKLSRANRLLSLFKAKPARFKRYKNFFQELQGWYTYLFEHLKERFLSRKSFDTLADHLQEVMVKSLSTMVDTHIKEQDNPQLQQQDIAMIAKAILQERGNIQAEISSQIQKAIDHHIPSQVDVSVRSYMSGHILHVHPAQTQTLSVPEQQYQLYLSMKDNPQLQQQDIAIWLGLQMKFKNLQNSEKRQKTFEYEAPFVSEGPEKIILSLHKFLATIFNDDDIEERTSRWVNKCVKKFNPYARYGVEHWKASSCKDLLHTRNKKFLENQRRGLFRTLNIIQVLQRTYWELGHEHKFVTKIVARRANECIVLIIEPDYKNLNKNDIEDMYLLIMNGKLGIESYQQKVNLTAPTMSFPGVEKHRMFSIIYEPVHGIIYKNSKKEKRVMRHSEIHKFCDATLNRVLEGLKSYNNDVKYGYMYKRENNHEEIIMANLPPLNHVADLPEDDPEEQPELAPEPDHLNEFAPHQIPQPEGNMNGWILKDDEEEEEEEEDPEMEEEMEEENDDDDAEVINPYEEADPLNLPPPDSDTESEDMAVAPTPDDHK
ncbi:hypothetical protein Tco_0348372, partial [Tanacetum coccineum]